MLTNILRLEWVQHNIKIIPHWENNILCYNKLNPTENIYNKGNN